MKKIYLSLKISFLQDIRYTTNFFFGMITPILSIMPIILATQVFNSENDISWYISGLVLWLFISQIIWGNGVLLQRERNRTTLDQLLLLPEKINHIVYMKSLYFVVKSFFSSLILIFMCFLIFNLNFDFLKFIIVIIIGFPFYYSLSIITSILCLRTHYIFPLLQVILGLMLIISGLTYDISIFFLFLII